nr:RING-H2 finger protein ATL57-like [Ipomoea batatas]
MLTYEHRRYRKQRKSPVFVPDFRRCCLADHNSRFPAPPAYWPLSMRKALAEETSFTAVAAGLHRHLRASQPFAPLPPPPGPLRRRFPLLRPSATGRKKKKYDKKRKDCWKWRSMEMNLTLSRRFLQVNNHDSFSPATGNSKEQALSPVTGFNKPTSALDSSSLALTVLVMLTTLFFKVENASLAVEKQSSTMSRAVPGFPVREGRWDELNITEYYSSTANVDEKLTARKEGRETVNETGATRKKTGAGRKKNRRKLKKEYES